jgi:hypothetical protein
MAVITDMGIPGTHAGLIYQPKLKNRYVAVFYAPSSVLGDVGAQVSNALGNAIGNAVSLLSESAGNAAASAVMQGLNNANDKMTALSAQCTKFKKPSINFTPIELHRYNSNVKISQSKYAIPDVAITLEDDISNQVAKGVQALLNHQHDLISNDQSPFLRTAPTASRYKFAIDLMTLDGSAKVLEIFHLSGCWIKDIDWGEYSYEAGEQCAIDITLSIDHFQQTFNSIDTVGQAIGGLNIPSSASYKVLDTVF